MMINNSFTILKHISTLPWQ